MARKIKSRKSRRRPSVAKSARRASRRVVVQAKKVYRRAKSINVTKKDIVLSVAGAGAGAIGSAVVLQKLPDSIPAAAKNAIVTAAGGFLAYKGVKKRNMALTGLGMGMAAVGARGLVGVAVPSLAAPFVRPLAAPYVIDRPRLNAPFVRTSSLAGCRSVKNEEYV